MARTEKKNEYPASVEADRNLLGFETYEDYLDSLIDIADLRNLRSIDTARIIANLGYRATGDTLSEKDFYVRREIISNIVFPKIKALTLSSEGITITDPFIQACADRERLNRVGSVHSIIFVRTHTSEGFEISGYIDYSHRLSRGNWKTFFRGKKTLIPTDADLGYYHWRHGTVRSNLSRNYEALMDVDQGLLFQNRHDHKVICIDPEKDPGQNTTKVRIFSPKYIQIEIYDHVVRK